MNWTEPPLFLWGLFVFLAIGALLPIRIETREDHIVITIVSAVAAGIIGPSALVLVWGGVVVAAPLIFGWNLLPRHRVELGFRAGLRSVAWVVLTAFAITVGFILAFLVYSGFFGRTYPIIVLTVSDFFTAGVAITIAWVGMMSVRAVAVRVVSGSFLAHGFDPLESELFPYVLPLMGGFPIVAASVAMYHPDYPWPALLFLWWCFPLYIATWFDLHRRRLAQELRRDVIAQQRLAAIGEVSARIVHQSRHQVGLMGWSIHRLRGLLGRSGAQDVAAAEHELDALADAKDRLSEILTSELLHETAGSARHEESEGEGGNDVAATNRLRDVVADVCDQLQTEAEREGVTLGVEIAPAAGFGSVPAALRDVIFNLVDNAIDAAGTRVAVHVDRRGGQEAIRVCDDGPGLTTSDANRMFEPFFTTKADGTGMGLAIADALVGDFGGDLRYERSDDETTFLVLLPALEGPQRRLA